MLHFHETFCAAQSVEPLALQRALDELEQVQTEALRRVTPPDQLDARIAERREFHRLLHDPATSDAEVVEHATQRIRLTFPLVPQAVADLREVLASGHVAFSTCEKPDTMVVLSNAFGFLRRSSAELTTGRGFLFATDSEYHAHASVAHVVGPVYRVLLSANLVMDLFGVLATYCEIADEAKTGKTPNLARALADASIRDHFAQPRFALQLPYQLAAAALGEQFRYASVHHRDVAGSRAHWGLYYCALAFLLGHELGHVALGHCDAAVDRGKPNFLGVLFAPDGLLHPRGVDAVVLAHYLKHYAPAHNREFEADALGTLAAANVAATILGDRCIGVVTASIVLGLIAWMDRSKYVIRTRRDPVTEVGQRCYNEIPASLDLYLPQISHPWGRSRQSVQILYLLLMTPKGTSEAATWSDKEREYLLRANQNASYFLSASARGALAATLYALDADGEVLCRPTPDGQLEVSIWHNDGAGRTEVTRRFRTPMRSFFGLFDSITERDPDATTP